MKLFHCDHCQHLVFFENVSCVNCGHALAYLPDLQDIASLEPLSDNLWRTPASGAEGRTYRLCDNYRKENVCNWAVPVKDRQTLCQSCRLTRIIPDLTVPGHPEAWYRLEIAKRRLVYSLLELKLPLTTRTQNPQSGLAFEFRGAIDATDEAGVLTGHHGGVITINVAEADDAEREKRRVQMHEPYRTLLGHFRHEIAHYYWDLLIAGDDDWLPRFRELFGDERADYSQSLQTHYQQGAPADWQQRFISAYASSHPWEDWAESWAHYLHMIDALETASASGLSLKPLRADEPSLKPDRGLAVGRLGSFDKLISNWFTLTYVLNNLNRSMGLADGYPFVLSTPAIDKLRLIHDRIAAIKDA